MLEVLVAPLLEAGGDVSAVLGVHRVALRDLCLQPRLEHRLVLAHHQVLALRPSQCMQNNTSTNQQVRGRLESLLLEDGCCGRTHARHRVDRLACTVLDLRMYWWEG